MIPSLTSIVQTRLLIAALLKVVAVFLWLSALSSPAYWITTWISSGFRARGLPVSTLASFAVTIAAGVALFLLAAPLSRAFVPLRFLAMCPRCRYPLVGSQECRCPECGLPLPEEFVDQFSALDISRDFEPSPAMNRANLLLATGIGGIVVSSLLVVIGLVSELASSGSSGFTSGAGFIFAFVGVATLLCFMLLASFAAKMRRQARHGRHA